MIGAFLTIFVACWVYQGAVGVKRGNVMRWVAIGAVMVFVAQMVFMSLEIIFFVNEDDIDLTDQFTGSMQATYRELMPSFLAFLMAAVYRTKLVMQLPINMSNLFSGINIFKGSGKNSEEDTSSES